MSRILIQLLAPALALHAGLLFARVEVTNEFAPSAGWLSPVEASCRAELCLNGSWQFQPMPVPSGFVRGLGRPPELAAARADGWSAIPIKIPSPWNVNVWGCGRNPAAERDHALWPDSVYFPSYPESWDRAEMGWLRRTFEVPAGWTDRRVLLHFEAVAGECEVIVNGRSAGRYFDKYLPFEFDITGLVRRDGPNELLVGVRSHALFEERSTRYPKMRAPFPCGSETEPLVGIWQDVFLLGVPDLRIGDVFMQPFVDRDEIVIEATVRNDGPAARTFSLGGSVMPWTNRPPDAGLTLPEVKARLDPGATTNLTLRHKVGGRLPLWSPAVPELSVAVLSLQEPGRTGDVHSTRFGWREFRLKGRQLLLNGKPIQLTGDFLHPFGPFVLSPSYARAWYQLIRDFGGNAARPHAQPHPRHYLDLADEMGLVVLDETAIFGSSVALNFEPQAAWSRFAEHYDGLILRDRNHPSVLGWSFGNELFAIFQLNNVTAGDADRWYRQLTELGLRARRLDPTRPWISCDGDEDLRGTLPVWSKHFGHGTPLDRLPDVDKPLMVGESGGTYYARPKQLAEFNGARAYESYEGRNEALAIDVWENITRMARPHLAYYSASETAWFGVEHLPFGYRDFSRPPTRDDGLFFTAPFREGKPGIQIERLPPFVATLNPGWDPSLPSYRPLAMFAAQQAALAPGAPKPAPWTRPPAATKPAFAPATVASVGFVGARDGVLARRMEALGLPLADGAQSLMLVDGDAPEAARALAEVKSNGATVVYFVGRVPPPDETRLTCTERRATALVPDPVHPWTRGFSLPDLYFAEEGPDRHIMSRGLSGSMPEGARVLLRASDTDWSLFNNAPEKAKCAAVLLGECLQKPSGAALVACPWGRGTLMLCTLDYRNATRAADAMWRMLFTQAGVKLNPPAQASTAAFDDQHVLIRALAGGRFAAASLEEARMKDFIGETSVRPVAGMRPWSVVESPSRDRFVFRELGQGGAEPGPFAVYFAFWLRSPRALDDLLAGGPDAPRLSLIAYAADDCRVFLNGREVAAGHTEPADYRIRREFPALPLQKGWNQLLVKVASSHLHGEQPGTLAVRLSASNEEYLRQLESAVSPPSPEARK